MQAPGFDSEQSGIPQYILVVNGKPEGPFTIEELKTRGIKPGDFIKTPAMDDYKEAHEVAELRQLFGFSRQPVPIQYFGSFDQRLLASALDWFIVSGGFILVAFIAILFIQDKFIRLIISFSLLIIIPLTKLVYHIVMESSVKQATIGKLILKIRVCDIYGERITVGRAMGRNVAKILTVLTLFVGYILAFFNKKQQCLHDMIAETLVIKDRLE
ncbi:RDD family protein [Mucilaginibacter segetis]|uniref:RDD family protein n=1 Tax=Mucilaginibacter segetis TaxID=2793071 RepID=A0A934PN94_9SPHI|nr:RDD family protein [Mucilaginibacter segetis]MBK0377689.1 RDD family protein [Mucilaginibacter segetis]